MTDWQYWPVLSAYCYIGFANLLFLRPLTRIQELALSLKAVFEALEGQNWGTFSLNMS